MAIKVKHEGNVTSRITAAGAGGRGKRAADDGKAFAQIAASEAQAGNKQLQGAHASPVSPGHASAPLTHAAAGSAPGISHAPVGHAGTGGGSGGSRGSSSAGLGSGAGASRRLKVTGDKFFEKPDKESVWDWDSQQWKREYLPGEWEAEVQQRVGDVKNNQELEILDSKHKQAMELAEQASLLGRERDVLGAKLKLPGRVNPKPPPAIRSPFPSAMDGQTGTPPAELYNILDKLDPQLLDIRNQFEQGGIREPFDNAMSVALATLSNNGMNNGVTPNDLGSGGGTVGEVFDSLMLRRDGAAPAASPMPPQDELAGVYARGGSIYGGQDASGVKPLSWLRSQGTDVSAGGNSVEANAYADGIEGMINALMRRA